MIIKNCEVCQTEIKVNPSRLKNKHHTCSKKCSGILSSSLYSEKIEVNCKICNKPIFYKKSHINKIKNPTCSRLCTSKMKSILYSTENPRSLKLNRTDRIFWDRCESYKLRAKNKNMDFNLTWEFLKSLFEIQNGKCAYTFMDMTFEKPKTYNTASLDRIDSKKGYTKDNVKWCINAINSMKSDYTMDVVVKIATNLAKKSTFIRPLKVKKIRDNSILPKRSNIQDAGYDLSISTIEDLGDLVKIGFGVAIEPDPTIWFMAAERSSLYKTGLSLTNKLGILDQTYRGEIMGVFMKTSLFKELPKIGDRLIQIIPQQQYHIDIEEVSELNETDRGTGGFGSTNGKS